VAFAGVGAGGDLVDREAIVAVLVQNLDGHAQQLALTR
jgi:hypothetical protein